jgi:hypothetical protein
MEFTDNPIEPFISDRGLAYMRPLTTQQGATVEVHDSSNAEHDELRLEFGPVLEQSTLDGKYSLAMGIGDAVTFAQQIIALAERRGVRLVDLEHNAVPMSLAVAWDEGHEAGRICERLADRIGTKDSGHGAGCEDEYPNPYRSDGPAPEVIDGLVDELDTATAKLNAVLPEPEGETRSDSGDILELGAYLATVYTAAALAGAIPRLIGDLDITAYTADINAHLESAAEAARRDIHDLALGPDVLGEPANGQTRVFPPRPYHLRSAGDYLSSLRTSALALAARAEVVRAEIACYLTEAPDPEPIPEYARDLLNTDTESE